MLVVMGIVAAIVAGLVVTYFIVDSMFSVPGYHGPITDHFNGRTFENLEPPERKGFIDFLRWRLTGKRVAGTSGPILSLAICLPRV